MARITKVELEQQLMCKGKELAAAREEISVLQAEVERLRRLAGAAAEALQQGDEQAQANAAQRIYREARPSVPHTRRPLPAHMQAAREAAMRLGRVVRVEM